MATKRQIEQAARVWRLALVAHMDEVGDSAPEVRAVAIQQAQDELCRRGYDYRQLLDEAACLLSVVQHGEQREK